MRTNTGSGEPGIGVAGADSSKLPSLDVPIAAPPTDARVGLPLRAADELVAALRAELAGVPLTETPRFERAAGRLLLAGEDGVAAARLALADDNPQLVVAGARTLLLSGGQEARAAIAARMTSKLPAAAAMPLFELTNELAPELHSDQQLVAWLAHPSAAVRAASERALSKRLSAALVPALRSGLSSTRSDARSRAAVLLERVGGTEAWNALADALADPSAEVAHRAAGALADAQDESAAAVRRRLLEQLRSGARLDRGLAYGLLTLVLREERTGEAVLTTDLVPRLVEDVGSSVPLVRGTAALALAGLGWRWEQDAPTPWLDKAVPEALLRELSGAEFHADISALSWSTQRRLARLTGESFGSDGRAWSAWWTENGAHFRARRAILSIPHERVGEFVLRYRSLGEGLVFDLHGPRAAPNAIGPAAIVLSESECAELVEQLAALQLFGAAREPGVLQNSVGFLCVLELGLGGATKTFGLPLQSSETWFQDACTLARAAYARNTWQQLRDERAFASAAEFLERERPWWSAEHTPSDRQRRRVELALGALTGGDEAARLAAHDALADEYFAADIARASDFAAWCAWLASAPLEAADVELALRGARAAAGAQLDAVRARELVEVLFARQAARAPAHAADLVAQGGAELALTLASDERAAARAAAVVALARIGSADALDALRRSTLDRDEGVAAAALRAIGAQHLQTLREAVRSRCASEQEASSLVRGEALRALGKLGAPARGEVENPTGLALFLRAFGESSRELEESAAAGLADYGDPAAAPVLLSLLSQPDGGALEQSGQAGLMHLGAAGWPDLLRVAQASNHPLRRKAILLLARQNHALACSGLLKLYTEAPDDAVIAAELCVLSARDLRGEPDPVQAYWDWWDATPHGDARAWLIDGAARVGITAPPDGALDAPIGAAGRGWLLGLLGRAETHLAERARRELSVIAGEELPPLPADAAARGELAEAWRVRLGRGD